MQVQLHVENGAHRRNLHGAESSYDGSGSGEVKPQQRNFLFRSGCYYSATSDADLAALVADNRCEVVALRVPLHNLTPVVVALDRVAFKVCECGTISEAVLFYSTRLAEPAVTNASQPMANATAISKNT